MEEVEEELNHRKKLKKKPRVFPPTNEHERNAWNAYSNTTADGREAKVNRNTATRTKDEENK